MDEAFVRSQGILNPDDTCPVAIIGCGAIGSFVAIALAKMGFNKKFYLYDADYVGIENVGVQLFGPQHIAIPKVEALKDLLIKLTTIDLYARYGPRPPCGSNTQHATPPPWPPHRKSGSIHVPARQP